MSQFGWENCPPAAKAQTQHFTDTVAHLLADTLVGVYLHGSLAMGCFNPRHSDLDLLVVTHQRMVADTKRQLAELALSSSCAPHPIELSVLVDADLVPWRAPAPFDFHYSEAWRARIQHDLRDGGWQGWDAQPGNDPDLAAHITIVRQRGRCLLGSPIARVFPVVPKEDYLASIVGDVTDALLSIQEAPVYAILNACRVDAFVRAGLICSKQEAGEWALKVVPEDIGATVALALKTYAASDQDALFEAAATERFVAYMRGQLPS